MAAFSLAAQTPVTLQSLPNRGDSGFTSAENRWRLTAVDVNLQNDDVAPSVRRVRNAYWRPILGASSRVEAHGNHVILDLPGMPSKTELIDIKGARWVVANFDHFKVLSIEPDGDSIYTEMSFKVIDVFNRDDNSPIKIGSTFDVDVPGGTVKNRDGKLASTAFLPSRYYLQPQHTYLLEVVPNERGGFYTVLKRWEIKDDHVAADQSEEISRVHLGESQLEGLSTLEAKAFIAEHAAKTLSK